MNETPPSPIIEDATTLRFSPRRIPLCFYPYFYQHCQQGFAPLCVGAFIFIAVVKLMGNLTSFEDIFRRQYSPDWKPAGIATVVSREPSTWNDFFIPFNTVVFAFDAPDGKRRQESCGCFGNKFAVENRYPVEVLQDRWDEYRLVGSWTHLFLITVEILLLSAVFVAAGTAHFSFGLRSGHRKRFLYRFGIATQSRCVGSSPIRFWSRFTPFVDALFPFVDTNGVERTAKMSVLRSFMKPKTERQRKRFDPDAPFVLFFDADAPERYELLYALGSKTAYDFVTHEFKPSWDIALAGYFMLLLWFVLVAVMSYFVVKVVFI